MNYFLNRLGEASTWAGLGAIASAANTAYQAGGLSNPTFWMTVVGGLIATVMPNAVGQRL